MRYIETINWIKSGKYRTKILVLLSKKPMLPSEMSKSLQINRVSISRILKDLQSKNLVDFVGQNTRTKTYFLTENAKKILEELK